MFQKFSLDTHRFIWYSDKIVQPFQKSKGVYTISQVVRNLTIILLPLIQHDRKFQYDYEVFVGHELIMLLQH